MQEFMTKLEAFDWMVLTVDDPYIDNFRIAFCDSEKELAEYKEKQADGCCGFFDEFVLINGRRAIIGCNYGH